MAPGIKSLVRLFQRRVPQGLWTGSTGFFLLRGTSNNKEHHYHLNEGTDSDYVQRNTTGIREIIQSVLARYIAVIANAMMWKWYYYASNILKLLHAGLPDAPPKDVFEAHEMAHFRLH